MPFETRRYTLDVSRCADTGREAFAGWIVELGFNQTWCTGADELEVFSKLGAEVARLRREGKEVSPVKIIAS